MGTGEIIGLSIMGFVTIILCLPVGQVLVRRWREERRIIKTLYQMRGMSANEAKRYMETHPLAEIKREFGLK